jgi:uncharacterized protein
LKITQESPTKVTIRKVSNQEIHIGDKVYQRSIALTADTVIGTWADKPVSQLREVDFDVLLELGPELIVLGTGPSCIFAPRELVFAFARRGIGLEVMDTGAAARTFNVLAGEGRSVAAILYLTKP